MMLILALLMGIQAELLCVVEVCRHGARSPISSYSWSTGTWPDGPGELSASGMRQHYLLGQEFRKRYIETAGLLNSSFIQEEVYVRSTDVNRTIMSAQSQLLGLYPKGKELPKSLWDKAIPDIPVSDLKQIKEELQYDAVIDGYQPIPINIVQSQDDLTLVGYSNYTCPRLSIIIEELQKEDEYKKKIADYEASGGLQDKIKQYLNMPDVPFEVAGWMADTIYCDLWDEYPLPAGLPEEVFFEMLAVMNYTITYYFKGEGGRLASSKFFQAVLDHFNMALNKTSNVKFAFYSAHDVTLDSFRSALGKLDDPATNAPFASTIMFELHSDKTVRVRYNDVPYVFDGCASEFCDFRAFSNYLEKIIVPDVETVCKNVTDEDIRRTNDIPFVRILSSLSN